MMDILSRRTAKGRLGILLSFWGEFLALNWETTPYLQLENRPNIWSPIRPRKNP